MPSRRTSTILVSTVALIVMMAWIHCYSTSHQASLVASPAATTESVFNEPCIEARRSVIDHLAPSPVESRSDSSDATPASLERGLLTVRVVDAEDRPLAGRGVRLYYDDAINNYERGDEVVTDDDGHARFRDVHAFPGLVAAVSGSMSPTAIGAIEKFHIDGVPLILKERAGGRFNVRLDPTSRLARCKGLTLHLTKSNEKVIREVISAEDPDSGPLGGPSGGPLFLVECGRDDRATHVSVERPAEIAVEESGDSWQIEVVRDRFVLARMGPIIGPSVVGESIAVVIGDEAATDWFIIDVRDRSRQPVRLQSLEVLFGNDGGSGGSRMKVKTDEDGHAVIKRLPTEPSAAGEWMILHGGQEARNGRFIPPPDGDASIEIVLEPTPVLLSAKIIDDRDRPVTTGTVFLCLLDDDPTTYDLATLGVSNGDSDCACGLRNGLILSMRPDGSVLLRSPCRHSALVLSCNVSGTPGQTIVNNLPQSDVIVRVKPVSHGR